MLIYDRGDRRILKSLIYAHLADDPLRQTMNDVASRIMDAVGGAQAI